VAAAGAGFGSRRGGLGSRRGWPGEIFEPPTRAALAGWPGVLPLLRILGGTLGLARGSLRRSLTIKAFVNRPADLFCCCTGVSADVNVLHNAGTGPRRSLLSR